MKGGINMMHCISVTKKPVEIISRSFCLFLRFSRSSRNAPCSSCRPMIGSSSAIRVSKRSTIPYSSVFSMVV